MVIPIQVLVSFYTKEFRNQDPFNRNVIDGNATLDVVSVLSRQWRETLLSS